MLVSQLEHGDLYGIDRLYTQNECCTVAVLFFEFGEVVLSLKACISSSVYVTTDTGVSSAAGLCFAAFLLFPRQFARPSRYDFVVSLVLGMVSGFLYLIFASKKTCACFWLRKVRQ